MVLTYLLSSLAPTVYEYVPDLHIVQLAAKTAPVIMIMSGGPGIKTARYFIQRSNWPVAVENFPAGQLAQASTVDAPENGLLWMTLTAPRLHKIRQRSQARLALNRTQLKMFRHSSQSIRCCLRILNSIQRIKSCFSIWDSKKCSGKRIRVTIRTHPEYTNRCQRRKKCRCLMRQMLRFTPNFRMQNIPAV